MNRGFIFTIEAIFAILLLITSVFVLGIYASEPNKTNIITGELYGDVMNNLYLNKEPTSPSTLNNYYCINYLTKNLEIKKMCDGYD